MIFFINFFGIKDNFESTSLALFEANFVSASAKLHDLTDITRQQVKNRMTKLVVL